MSESYAYPADVAAAPATGPPTACVRLRRAARLSVVSQDGGIRLVRQHAGQVLFWNQLIL